MTDGLASSTTCDLSLQTQVVTPGLRDCFRDMSVFAASAALGAQAEGFASPPRLLSPKKQNVD
eukprot:1572607-Amphidinium_carterae.1